MIIECYYATCPHHSCHTKADDGPLCYEEECLALPKQLAQYERDLQKALKSWKEEDNARCQDD